MSSHVTTVTRPRRHLSLLATGVRVCGQRAVIVQTSHLEPDARLLKVLLQLMELVHDAVIYKPCS